MSDSDWMNMEQLRAQLQRERELLTKACAERDRLGQQIAADREAQSKSLAALRDAVKQARSGVELLLHRGRFEDHPATPKLESAPDATMFDPWGTLARTKRR